MSIKIMGTHSNENNSGANGRGLRGPRFYRFRWEYWNKFGRENICSKKWSWRYYNRWYWGAGSWEQCSTRKITTSHFQRWKWYTS